MDFVDRLISLTHPVVGLLAEPIYTDPFHQFKFHSCSQIKSTESLCISPDYLEGGGKTGPNRELMDTIKRERGQVLFFDLLAVVVQPRVLQVHANTKAVTSRNRTCLPPKDVD